ncbi:MAG: Ig-like domain-containing protein, partial [Longimicrobiales bacterium]
MDPSEGFEEMVLEAGDWPDTLIAGQSGSLAAGLFLEGSPVEDAPIRWRSDDTVVVWIDPSSEGDSVSYQARRHGETRVEAYLQGPPPYPDTAARTPVTVLLDGVRFMTADTTLTALGDTLFVWACGLGVEDWEVFDAGVEWTRPDRAVQGDVMTGDSLRAVAAAQGLDTVIVTHPACAVACADTLLITVDQVPVDVEASVDTLAMASLGDEVTLDAAVTDRRGNPVTDEPVTWSLVSGGDVVSLTADGAVTSLTNGSARVVATAGDRADTVVVDVWQTIVGATLDRDTVTFGTLAVEDSLVVTFTDANHSVLARPVSPVWTTTDSTIVSAAPVAADSARVRVASVHFGEAIVGVSAEGVSASAVARVVPDRLAVTAGIDTLNALGDTVAFVAVAYDASNTAFAGEAVVWEALDTAVLDLLAGGTLATSKATGVGRVAASLVGVVDTAAVVVRQVVAAITVSPATGEMVLGDTLQLQATATDSNGVEIPGYGMSWSTSDGTVATVDSNGVVTGAGVGTAAITASGGGVSETSDVTVDVYTAETCTDPGATEHSTDVTTAETWSLAASPHRVTGSLSVQSGGSVTIEAGAVVCFDDGVQVDFAGGRLAANGTAAEPVALIATDAGSPWTGLRFSGTPADTSRLTNVRVVDARSTAGAIEAADAHPIVLDSVRVRQAHQVAVQLTSPGSRMVRSNVDTTRESSYAAVVVGSTSRIESITVRGAAGDGVRTVSTGTGQAAVLQDVTILGAGSRGLSVQSDSARLANVRIERSTGIGLDARDGYDLAEASGVRVLDGVSYGAQLGLHNVHVLAPTVVDQDSLLGNAKDTLLVDGGNIAGTVDFDGNPVTTVEVEAGPSLPWRVTGDLTIDAAGILRVKPGARLAFEAGRRASFSAGRLIAQGTADSTIVFTSTAAEKHWDHLNFSGDPKDTSYVAHAVLEWASGATNYGAVYSGDQHPVAVDNTVIRQSEDRAAYLRGPGSRLIDSRVDTVAGTRPAVVLGGGTHLATTTIRGVEGSGIRVIGSGVVIDTVDVLNAGAEGASIQGASASIHGLRIEGAAGTGLIATGSYPLTAATGVRVLNGASYGAELGINNLLTIAPTPADQDSLLGSAKDTLIINGGTIEGTVDVDGNPVTIEELTVRSDIPWRVDGGFTMDSASVLHIRPGAYLGMAAGQSMSFRSARISALGTADSTIVFTTWDPNGWGGLRLYGAPPDTSRLRHVKLEWAAGADGVTSSSYDYTVAAGATHPLTLDTVHIRRSWQHAVDLLAPGSRLADVTIDTTGSGSYPAVILGNSVTVLNTTLRDAAGDGVRVRGDSTLLEGVRIENAGGIGLQADGGASMRRGGSVRVVGAGSYGARLGVENLYAIAPTALDQDSLMGNGRDTLVIWGGTLRGQVDGSGSFVALAEVTARADLPWKVDQSFTIDSAGVLTVQRGARLAFAENTGASFHGGRLLAVGTVDSTIVFTAQAPPKYWNGLSFRGDPQDTSVIRNALVEWSSGSRSTFTYYADYALTAGDQHPLTVDSTRLRRIQNQAVELASRGSRLTSTTVDTTQDAGYAAVRLGPQTEIASSVVRDPAGVGVEVVGDSVRLSDVRILGAGGVGLVASNSYDLLNSDGLTITGGGTIPARVGIAQLVRLAPTPAQQDSLTGNANDTVEIAGGTLVADTLTLGAGLGWWASDDVQVDSAALLVVRPGVRWELGGSSTGLA